MAINKRLIGAGATASAGGLTPSEHFGVVLYEGDGASSHSINGGKFGAAGYFTNAGVVTIPSSVIDTNKHSLSVWFNTSATSGTQTVFEFNTGNRIIFRAASTDSNKANFGGGGWFDHGISFSANTWYHLVITFNSGSPAKIYVNGSLQHTTGNISKASDGSANYLGANNSSGGNNLLGKIDQFRVFQKELSSSEVSTLYAETAATVESLSPLGNETVDTLQVLGDTSCTALYRFENNEDDESGNYNGTGTEIEYAVGRYEQAAKFDGSDSTFTYSTSVINVAADHSISFWLNIDSIATQMIIWNHDSNIRMTSGGNILYRRNTSGVAYDITSSTTLSTGSWYHIAASFNTSSGMALYIDNVAQGTNSYTGGVDSKSGDFGLMYRVDSNSEHADGKIDQVRFFNKTISASEVTTLYEENSLVASYRFEGNSNDDRRTFNGTDTSVTYEYGLGFQPDFVWIKNRTTTGYEHFLFDSTRGAGGNKSINSDSNNAQGAENTAAYGYLSSFDTGGFTLNAGTSSAVTVNKDGDDYAAWAWKANGGTTSSNTDGSGTSTVQVNSDAGFSIAKMTFAGAGSIGHGLGVTPDLVLLKGLSAAEDWQVYHTATGTGKYLKLNTTDAVATRADSFSTVNSTIVTNNWTGASVDWIMYSFVSVDNFSKFGSYLGNGGTSNIVEIGFEPAFVMIKYVDEADQWIMHDNKRDLINPRTANLRANSSDAEIEYADYAINFLSNGFELLTNQSGQNKDGGEYLYMAFAADPDTEVPTLARSFNTVTWTGTGSSQTINGLGFAPNLVWIKQIGGTTWHNIQDTIIGATKHLYTNATNALDTTSNGLTSFDSDGFTLGGGNGFNGSSQSMVGWAWKADDNEPTIFGLPVDAAAVAVYKFEDNADDVTNNYDGTATNVTYTASGKFNKGATFPSSDSKINLPTDFGAEGEFFSISLWFKTSSANGSYMFSKRTGNNTFHIRIDNSFSPSGKICVNNWQSTASASANAQSTSGGYADGNWHHFVFTYNGTASNRTVCYIDGALDSGMTLDYNLDTQSVTNGNNIGNFDGDSHQFSGTLDQIRVYDKTLDAASVTKLYNETTAQNSTLNIGTQGVDSAESIVSANANAGFSIVKYKGTGVAGTKIPHGLSAAPEVMIIKSLDSSLYWAIYHKYNTGSSGNSATERLKLPGTSATATTSIYWNSTAPTATEFTIGTDTDVNTNGDDFIAYCFHAVSNFSKFGSYTGTGTGTNQLINTGFQPDWVMFKDASAGGSWWMQDSVRGADGSLKANDDSAKTVTNYVSFESNGFRVSGDANGTSTWVYFAFKIN